LICKNVTWQTFKVPHNFVSCTMLADNNKLKHLRYHTRGDMRSNRERERGDRMEMRERGEAGEGER